MGTRLEKSQRQLRGSGSSRSSDNKLNFFIICFENVRRDNEADGGYPRCVLRNIRIVPSSILAIFPSKISQLPFSQLNGSVTFHVPSVGRCSRCVVSHNFQKWLEVTLPCSYRSTGSLIFRLKQNHPSFSHTFSSQKTRPYSGNA